MRAWILKHLLPFLHRACEHDEVTADLLEGGESGYALLWCRICGAYRFAEDAAVRPSPWTLAVSSWVHGRKTRPADGKE